VKPVGNGIMGKIPAFTINGEEKSSDFTYEGYHLKKPKAS
jgi:hypothetical protein